MLLWQSRGHLLEPTQILCLTGHQLNCAITGHHSNHHQLLLGQFHPPSIGNPTSANYHDFKWKKNKEMKSKNFFLKELKDTTKLKDTLTVEIVKPSCQRKNITDNQSLYNWRFISLSI